MFVSGVFPEADKDPVIQIGAMVIRQGEAEPFVRTIFTLKECAPIVGTQVQCFNNEREMLEVSVSLCSSLTIPVGWNVSSDVFSLSLSLSHSKWCFSVDIVLKY